MKIFRYLQQPISSFFGSHEHNSYGLNTVDVWFCQRNETKSSSSSKKKTDKRNESHTFHSHQRAKGIYTFFSNRSVQIWCVSTIVYRAVCLNFFSAFFFSYLLRFKSNVSYKSICHCMWPRLNQSHHTTYHAYNTKTENDFNFE